MRNIFPILILVLISACQIPNPQITNNAPAYFDMKSFMENEIQKLAGKSLKKKITLNGKVEEILVEKPNWKTELSEFLDADINKLSYVDKYEIEFSKGGFEKYTAKEKDLLIQLLQVNFHADDNTSILIEKKSENVLNHSNKKLDYNTAGNYTIQAFRHSLGGKPDTIMIEGFF